MWGEKSVVPHFKLWTGGLVSWMLEPPEFIQDPSPQKTAEGLSPESRASVPGCPLRSGDSKRAEFLAERIVYNVQQTVRKLSGAVHVLPSCGLYFHLNRVFLTVVHKGNSLIVLLDTIDGHARLAVPGADL